MMERIEAVRHIEQTTSKEDLFVTSLGALRNDWFNTRSYPEENTFFLTGMGTVAPMALGLATALPHRRVFALDTDGSTLMNTGAMCTLADQAAPNLTIVVFDNETYESIGGIPTATSRRADLAGMAAAAGCLHAETASTIEDFRAAFDAMSSDNEFGFLVAKIEQVIYPWPEDRRKTSGGVEDKFRFIRYVEELEGIAVHRAVPTSSPFA